MDPSSHPIGSILLSLEASEVMMKLESTECQALIYAYNNPLKMYYTIILILQMKKPRH